MRIRLFLVHIARTRFRVDSDFTRINLQFSVVNLKLLNILNAIIERVNNRQKFSKIFVTCSKKTGSHMSDPKVNDFRRYRSKKYPVKEQLDDMKIFLFRLFILALLAIDLLNQVKIILQAQCKILICSDYPICGLKLSTWLGKNFFIHGFIRHLFNSA